MIKPNCLKRSIESFVFGLCLFTIIKKFPKSLEPTKYRALVFQKKKAGITCSDSRVARVSNMPRTASFASKIEIRIPLRSFKIRCECPHFSHSSADEQRNIEYFTILRVLTRDLHVRESLKSVNSM